MKPTYVYIIANELNNSGTSPIKVGVSETPRKRLSQIQTGSSSKLMLYGCYEFVSRECALRVEKDFHIVFGAMSIRGEWSDLDPPAAAEAIENYLDNGMFTPEFVDHVHGVWGFE